MSRYALRITRFDDQWSFQEVAEFLAALYPERDIEEFETGLARLPCLITHDGEETAARHLERALIARGARTRLTLVDSVDRTLGTDDTGTSQEVDIAFLDTGPSKAHEKPKATPLASTRARSRGLSKPLRGEANSASSTAPWEDD